MYILASYMYPFGDMYFSQLNPIGRVSQSIGQGSGVALNFSIKFFAAGEPTAATLHQRTFFKG